MVTEMRGRSLASAAPLSNVSLHDAGATISAPFLTLTTCLLMSGLVSCGKKDPESPQAAKTAADAAQSSWREWISKSSDTGWWQQQWAEASEAAKASLEALKAIEVKKRLSELTEAFESKDDSKVEGIAAELGRHLSLNKLEQGMRFVILQRKEGGAAALKAIDDYAARTDLNEFEKAAAHNLQKSAALLQRDDFRGWVSVTIFFACECKLGAHRGGLLAIPIISILFPDYLEKPTPKP